MNKRDESLTRERYKEALKDVIKLVLLNEFAAIKWTKKWGINNLFVTAVIQLDYIDKEGAGRNVTYSTTLTPESVTNEMAFKVHDRVKFLVKQRDAASAKRKEEGTAKVQQPVNRNFVSPRDMETHKQKVEKTTDERNVELPKEKVEEKRRDVSITTVQQIMDDMENRVMDRINTLKQANSRTIMLPEKDKAFYIVDESKVVFKPLTDWSDEHLLSELCNRGYSGTLEKLTQNTKFSRMETIELNKDGEKN